MRWPNASYSASSIAETLTPSRLAASRSMSGRPAGPRPAGRWRRPAGAAALQPRDQLRHPLAQPVAVRVLEDELELRAAHAVLDREVLHRLQVDRDAGTRLARCGAAAMITLAARPIGAARA